MMPDDDDGDENDELWIQSDLAFIFFFLNSSGYGFL